MPESTVTPPSDPSPAAVLKELATAIEAGDLPDLVDLRAALGSFRAAKLDKRAQQHVIEAREDAKAGRMPDALLLRMIAKALEKGDPTPATVAEALKKASFTSMKKAKPAPSIAEKTLESIVRRGDEPAAAPVTVAERTVRPDGVGITPEMAERIANAAEGAGGFPTPAEVVAAGGRVGQAVAEGMAPIPPRPSYSTYSTGVTVVQRDGTVVLRNKDEDLETKARLEAAEARGEDIGSGGAMFLMGQKDREAAEQELERSHDERSISDGDAAAILEQFASDPVGVLLVEAAGAAAPVPTPILARPGSTLHGSIFGPYEDDENERYAEVLGAARAARAGNGNGGTVPTFDRTGISDAFGPKIRLPLDGGAETPPGSLFYMDETEASETYAELVGRAAGELEKLQGHVADDHGDLISDLYALAARLEETPLVDPDEGTLLERVERAITARIERAIKAPGELPAWIMQWARDERVKEQLLGFPSASPEVY